MPPWVPYAVGIKFAKDKTSWVNEHKIKIKPPEFRNRGLVGKSHRIVILNDVGSDEGVSVRVTKTEVIVKTNLPLDSPQVAPKLSKACERALRSQSQALLPVRLQTLARQHGYSYKDVKIKKLTSRWGSCSSAGTITLSFYLIQLPWNLIDYVLLHELTHTRHMNHSPKFWTDLDKNLPAAKLLRKEIKVYQPTLKIN
jgi:predicted metal-dependent hydrolase